MTGVLVRKMRAERSQGKVRVLLGEQSRVLWTTGVFKGEFRLNSTSVKTEQDSSNSST